MRLEEAAEILGLSLDDITLDDLKQTYKKLSIVWDPEKVAKHSDTQYRLYSYVYLFVLFVDQ